MTPAGQSAARPVPNTDAILTAEFQYIAQSAFQANEDRSRVTSFYLVTLASFIAAVFSSSQLPRLILPLAHWAFVVLFLVLSVMSVLTLLQLVRLRQSWFDAVAAMNQIKDYYANSFPDIVPALAWRGPSLPARYKPWSVSFLLALQVAILGGVSAGAAIIFAGLGLNAQSSPPAWAGSWALAAAAMLGCVGAELWLYRRLLAPQGPAMAPMRAGGNGP
jgi:hypothetical protein